MYPRLFEIPLPFDIGGMNELTVYSYGFMIVVGVLAAAWMAGKELDRLYRSGRVGPARIPGEGGKQGRTREASPSYLMGTLATLAVVAGFLGARVLFILERPADFLRRPLGMLFASGGFTFYGGLIVAALAVVWYIRSRGLRVAPFADALAPGLMLAYGVGRIGCYLAGDGDWGIPADLALKPDWLPMWLWAETFPGNILGVDIPAPGVYPTMLYEFAAAALIAGILWALRRHPYRTGWLFSLYLALSAVERFFIEMIRVTKEYDVLGLHPTEAQVIAVVLFGVGVIGLFRLSKRRSDALPEKHDHSGKHDRPAKHAPPESVSAPT